MAQDRPRQPESADGRAGSTGGRLATGRSGRDHRGREDRAEEGGQASDLRRRQGDRRRQVRGHAVVDRGRRLRHALEMAADLRSQSGRHQRPRRDRHRSAVDPSASRRRWPSCVGQAQARYPRTESETGRERRADGKCQAPGTGRGPSSVLLVCPADVGAAVRLRALGDVCSPISSGAPLTGARTGRRGRVVCWSS